MPATAKVLTIEAVKFKANCPSLLNQLASGQIEKIVITKGGETVGIMTRPAPATLESDRPAPFPLTERRA